MSINFNYNYPQVAREAGFKLRQYKDGPLDWRLLGSLEVDRILSDQRLEQIDNSLAHLSEAPLASLLDTNILDSGIAKYFILSQYAIQYLLFCRKFLDETVRELREVHAESQLNVAKLRKSLTEANNEILQLHKKMTQIEAIHEVVYPCHLCSKSFISNEALNIHIGRRHAGRGAADVHTRRTETPSSAPKERDHHTDLSLINTIKLELEIKQLKERLNNAERDIRERNSGAFHKRDTPRDTGDATAREMRNIGIQSNLAEAKEQDDDESVKDDSELQERKEQLEKLQAQIKDFEEWRATQQLNNEESIADINKKLTEVVQALEQSKAVQVAVPMPVAVEQSTMERRASPSVEDLERILMEKVTEIGKMSAEKLEEVVHKLEVNYRGKLEQLEREIKQKNDTDREHAIKHKRPSKLEVVKVKQLTESETTSSESSNEQEPRPSRVKRSAVMESRNEAKHKSSNDTYEIEGRGIKANIKELTTEQQGSRSTKEEVKSLSSASNQTFVKITTEPNKVKVLAKSQSLELSNASTDISETLSEHSKSSAEQSSTHSSDTESEHISDAKPQQSALPKTSPKTRPPKKFRTITKKPKPTTRNDVQKIMNKRLAVHGCDAKAKTISNAGVKRVSAELTEKRKQLKMKYPHFYATRNKIKKLVDKLCSTKLPEDADLMLKTKTPLKPPRTDLAPRPFTRDSSTEDQLNSFETLEQTSTPLQHNVDSDFKQRLERILASPVRQPSSSSTEQLLITAQVHKADDIIQPVPLARKRVMFNTRSSEIQDDHIVAE